MVISKFLRSISNKNNVGISLEEPSSDSIPYACHYSPETILTKNGELLQIIKLEDFYSDKDVRNELRSSIIKNVIGKDVAITIHTVRNYNPISIPWSDKYKDSFSYNLHKSWRSRKKSQVSYINDIYVSVIVRGLKNKISLLNLPLHFSFTYVKNRYSKFLQEQHKKLSLVTDSIIDDLSSFNSRRLGLDKDGNSELLHLFRLLISLLSDRKPLPLATKDLSSQLLEDYVNAFGFNSFEVLCNNKKRFASILDVKRYREIEVSALSVAMQGDIEFVITETIDFDYNATEFKRIEYQSYLFDISHQEELKKITQLDKFDNNKERCVNHHISVMPIASSLDELENSILHLIKSFSQCGISLFRHDISLENAFYNILPANFAFRTLSYLSIVDNIAGFALLHALRSGKIMCKQWGYAITLFWSIHETPYFFNFHNDGIGHTTIIGPMNSGKTILQNFMISESQKIAVRTFIIDNSMKSRIFINALDGEYVLIDKENMSISYNPFTEDDSLNNRKLISDILKRLVSNKQDLIETVCENIFTLPIKKRTLENIHKIMLPFGKRVDELFSEKGFFSSLFKGDHQSSLWDNRSIGFNINNLSNEYTVTLISIILHKIESMLDGRPTIIVLEEVWSIVKLFPNNIALSDFLHSMSELNCVVIFTSSDTEAMLSSEFTKYLNGMIGTQIFLPKNVISKSYIKNFGITQEDLLMINNLQLHNRHFFLKQGSTSIVFKLDVSDMIECQVLSSNKQNIDRMKEAIIETGSKESHIWLPVFYNKIQK